MLNLNVLTLKKESNKLQKTIKGPTLDTPVNLKYCQLDRSQIYATLLVQLCNLVAPLVLNLQEMQTYPVSKEHILDLNLSCNLL